MMEPINVLMEKKALQDSVSSQTDAIIPGTPVVFLWLKQWDFSVFGSELKTTTDDVLSALKRHTTVSQQKKVSNRNSSGWNKDFKSNSGTFKEHNHFDKENYNSHGDQQLHNKSKETGPPEQKINASDDRSSSTIETKILDVVQMNSVIADSRPKCLVIDGALGDGKGAMDVILKMVTADKRSDTGAESEQSGKSKKDTPLLRPVICICNDLYAPAL